MIAFIRVNFPATPASAMWSDSHARGFMDPAIPFSMAHFWRQTTFNQVAFDYQSFAPITITDPRPAFSTANEMRIALVAAVFAELHRTQSPDWARIDRAFIFFAERGTDMFGGGQHATPGGSLIPVAVFSADSHFDGMAQEIGHAFGLRHEWDATGMTEYGCPYSVMSATNIDLHFERPLDARLPGVPAALGLNAPCIVGPHIPVAHLYLNHGKPANPEGAVDHRSMTLVCVDDAHPRQDVMLVARDVAIDDWPGPRPVFAAVLPTTSSGDTHFLELRRPTGYDGGIGHPVVFILAAHLWANDGSVAEPSTLMLKYMGALVPDVSEYDAPDGSFHAHVTEMKLDGSAATVVVTAGRVTDYSVRLSEPEVTRTPQLVGNWQEVVVKPCRSYPAKSYEFRTTIVQVTQVFTATALGYGQPTFTWFVNDVKLEPDGFVAAIPASCRTFEAGLLANATTETVLFRQVMQGPVLQLESYGQYVDIRLSVRVEVSHPGAPTRSVTVTGDCDTLDIDWDVEFQRDLMQCLKDEVTEDVDAVTTAGGHPGQLSAAQIRRDTLRVLGIGIPEPDGVGARLDAVFDLQRDGDDGDDPDAGDEERQPV